MKGGTYAWLVPIHLFSGFPMTTHVSLGFVPVFRIGNDGANFEDTSFNISNPLVCARRGIGGVNVGSNQNF